MVDLCCALGWCDMVKEYTRTYSSRGHVFDLIIIFRSSVLILHLWHGRDNISFYHVPVVAAWDWSLEDRARAAPSTHCLAC